MKGRDELGLGVDAGPESFVNLTPRTAFPGPAARRLQW